jgi:hypothetical protein
MTSVCMLGRKEGVVTAAFKDALPRLKSVIAEDGYSIAIKKFELYQYSSPVVRCPARLAAWHRPCLR